MKKEWWISHGNSVVLASILICAGWVFGQGLPDFFHPEDHSFLQSPNLKTISFDLAQSPDPSRFWPRLSLAGNYRLARLEPWLWYGLNILLHLFNGFLVFQLIRLILQLAHPTQSITFTNIQFKKFSLAWLGSLIFLFHPHQVETVFRLTERATLVGAFFYFSACTIYLSHLIHPTRFKVVGFLFCCLGGVFSKPAFVSLPCLLLLFHMIILKYSIAQPFCQLKLWTGLFFILASVTMVVVKRTELSWLARHDLQMFIVGPKGIYLKEFFKEYLSIFSLGFSRGWIALPAFLISLAAAWRMRNSKQWGIFLFAGIWILITAFPQTFLFTPTEMIREDWLYLPIFGYALAVVVFVAECFPKKRTYWRVLVPAVLILLLLTLGLSRRQSDPAAALKKSIYEQGKKLILLRRFGEVLWQQGKLVEARALFRLALVRDPLDPQTRLYLGWVLLDMGNQPAAQLVFENLEGDHPVFPEIHVGLGFSAFARQDENRAANHFKRTLQLDSKNSLAHFGLGMTAQSNKQFKLAESEYRQALHLNPDIELVHYNLGNLYFKTGRFYLAKVHYEEAAKIRPDFAEAWHNKGNVFFYFRDFEKAVGSYRQALRLKPQAAQFHFNLANALYALGEVSESRKEIEIALEIFKKEGRKDMIDKILPKLPVLFGK